MWVNFCWSVLLLDGSGTIFSKGDSEVKIQCPNTPHPSFFSLSLSLALRALNHDVVVVCICSKYLKGSIHKEK